MPILAYHSAQLETRVGGASLMGSADIEKSLSEKFPFYTEEERSLLKEIILDSERKTVRFIEAKNSFLQRLYADLVRFYKWDASLEERIHIRKRLLNIAGLFAIISIKDLRDLSGQAKLTQRKAVHENPVDPLGCNLMEINSYDIKYIKVFADLYSKISLETGLSALDFIAGSREKRHYPRTQFTVFRRKIQDEVLSKEYLTASSEPLTQTQLVSVYDPTGLPRDLMTIGFDMVYESAYVDFFHHEPNLSPVSLLRNSHIVGKNFLVAGIERCVALDKGGARFLEEFPLFFDCVGRTRQDVTALLEYLTDSLIPDIEKKIQNWNLQLGLPSEHQSIVWEGESN